VLTILIESKVDVADFMAPTGTSHSGEAAS